MPSIHRALSHKATKAVAKTARHPGHCCAVRLEGIEGIDQYSCGSVSLLGSVPLLAEVVQQPTPSRVALLPHFSPPHGGRRFKKPRYRGGFQRQAAHDMRFMHCQVHRRMTHHVHQLIRCCPPRLRILQAKAPLLMAPLVTPLRLPPPSLALCTSQTLHPSHSTPKIHLAHATQTQSMPPALTLHLPLKVQEYQAGKAPFPSVRVSGSFIIDFAGKEMAALAGASGEDGSFPPASGQLDHLCLCLEDGLDMEDVGRRLEAAGVPPLKQFDGYVVSRFGARGTAKSVYVRTPEGATLELRTYPDAQ